MYTGSIRLDPPLGLEFRATGGLVFEVKYLDKDSGVQGWSDI